MHLLTTFARAYPLQSAVMLIALLVAGLVEGISLTALLPLLDLVLNQSGESAAETSSGIGDFMLRAIEAAGFTPSVTILLVIILFGAILKGGLALLARQKVGYIVAHVS